jgi:hypothetical protein
MKKNLVLRFGFHSQDISLYIGKYSQIWKNPKYKTLLLPCILDEGKCYPNLYMFNNNNKNCKAECLYCWVWEPKGQMSEPVSHPP